MCGCLQVLTVWIPVSDVRPDNGCMYVVPKEFDEYRDRDDVQEHMLVQKRFQFPSECPPSSRPPMHLLQVRSPLASLCWAQHMAS